MAAKIARALRGTADDVAKAQHYAGELAELNRHTRQSVSEGGGGGPGRAGPSPGPGAWGQSGIAAAVIDSSALIAERTADFVGRRGLISRIHAAVNTPELHSGYIVISGEPGIGKTALLAKVVRDWDLVHHFNSVLTGVTSGEKFLRNICAQLIGRYQLPYERLPDDTVSDSSVLLAMLAQAAAGRRLVVGVDAIDEVAGGAAAQNRLFLPPALPPGVFMLLTTRDPASRGLYVDERHDVVLDENDPENIADLTEYVEAFLTQHHGVMRRRLADAGMTPSRFTALLTERSEGNFMYVRHVLRAVRDGSSGMAAVGTLAALPRGLQAYYLYLEQQLAGLAEPGADRQLAILAVLAAWPAPLTAGRIAQFAGEKLSTTRAVLRAWASFLNRFTESEEPMYALYHASFRDFLADRLDMSEVRGRIGAGIEDVLA
jgi:AAA ATPase-like protein